MQLESVGSFLLLCLILKCGGSDAAVPALWRREGVNFDVGIENLGSRGVPALPTNDDDAMNLIDAAFRWARNHERESLKRETLPIDPRAEENEIDQISEKLKSNSKEIHEIQRIICDIMQSICKSNKKTCRSCPWVLDSTEEPKSTTATEMPSSTKRPRPIPNGSCGIPATPDNGYVENNSTTLNSLIILHCNLGYDLIGEDRMICTAIWSTANEKYQYSWAPQMSAICKPNGEPSLPMKTTTTASPKSTDIKIKVEKKSQAKQDTYGQNTALQCMQPKRTGECKAAIPRFYYNYETQECQPFIYGGCHGNSNNFKSAQECLCTCKMCI